MKHATAQSLDRLEPLLVEIRRHAAFKEKSRGVFYLLSRAALHFHEDPAGLFADLRCSQDWQRFPVNTRTEQGALLRELMRGLGCEVLASARSYFD
ncbi:MAG: hypothetical protein ACHQAY_16000 [Hyphomicrobiales bacterium]